MKSLFKVCQFDLFGSSNCSLLNCLCQTNWIHFIHSHTHTCIVGDLRLEDSHGEVQSIGVAWGGSTWRNIWRLHKVRTTTSHRVDSVEFGTEFPLVCICQFAFFIVLHKSVGYGSPLVFPLVVEVSGWPFVCWLCDWLSICYCD